MGWRVGIGSGAVLMALGACAALGFVRQDSDGAPGGAEPGPQVSQAGSSRLLGTPSCSGRGCHGDLATDRARPEHVSQASYTIWLNRDPHASAFAVLRGRWAQTIARNLGLSKPASETVQCLACHTNPLAAQPNAGPAMLAERDHGVGCEACHGPAGNWLDDHKTRHWQGLSRAEKQAACQAKGMTDLEDLRIRARVCAGCHVGAPGDPPRGVPVRDMNHDMIAAGHPVLAFEFGAFLRAMPAHWVEKNREPTFQARAWTVGQAASAQAALELLADRCDHAGPSRPWPEFAEYECVSCHHDLGATNGERRSLPRMRAWYFAGLSQAWSLVNGKPESPMPGLDGLRKALEKSPADRQTIARQARQVAELLSDCGRRAEQQRLSPKAVLAMRKALATRGAGLVRTDLDSAIQAALGVSAMQQAYEDAASDAQRRPARAEQVNAAIQVLLQRLGMPGYHGILSEPGKARSGEKRIRALFDQLK